MPTEQESIAAAVQRIKEWTEATGYDPPDRMIYIMIYMMELRAMFECHNEKIEMMRWWVRDMEKDIQANDGVCPHCNCRLGKLGNHKDDCEMAIMIKEVGKK